MFAKLIDFFLYSGVIKAMAKIYQYIINSITTLNLVLNIKNILCQGKLIISLFFLVINYNIFLKVFKLFMHFYQILEALFTK